MTIKLSLLFTHTQGTLQEVIDFCLDNKIDTIINDFSPRPPYVEYSLSDLEYVWDNLKRLSC